MINYITCFQLTVIGKLTECICNIFNEYKGISKWIYFLIDLSWLLGNIGIQFKSDLSGHWKMVWLNPVCYHSLWHLTRQKKKIHGTTQVMMQLQCQHHENESSLSNSNICCIFSWVCIGSSAAEQTQTCRVKAWLRSSLWANNVD